MVTVNTSNVVNLNFSLAALPDLSITGWRTTPATNEFNLSGYTKVPGRVVVWATTSLAPPTIWVAVQTNDVPGGMFSFTVPGGNSQAFYRLMAR